MLAKHFSISVDSTPDLSYVEQLPFIIRYVKSRNPVERFLKFVHIEGHKSECLAESVLIF